MSATGAGDSNGGPMATISASVTESEALEDLASFELKEILRIDSEHKASFLHAIHIEKKDPAVIILEKKGFEKEKMVKFLEKNEKTRMIRLTQNNVFGNYDFFPPLDLNVVKCTVIYPATEKQIDRFREQSIRMVVETPEIYQQIVLPFIVNEAPFSHQWVYNILEKKSEQDRIIVRDDDPLTGFVLGIDLKWDGTTLESLYLQAMVMRRDIKSIRDLRPSHIPLLENIREKSLAAIKKKYGLPANQIRAYFHYHPTYYHLHIHFVTVQWEAPAFGADRAHLLDTVIGNLRSFPDYYEKATLTYSLKENDPILAKLNA